MILWPRILIKFYACCNALKCTVGNTIVVGFVFVHTQNGHQRINDDIVDSRVFYTITNTSQTIHRSSLHKHTSNFYRQLPLNVFYKHIQYTQQQQAIYYSVELGEIGERDIINAVDSKHQQATNLKLHFMDFIKTILYMRFTYATMLTVYMRMQRAALRCLTEKLEQ